MHAYGNGNHYSTVTRTEPEGNLLEVTCYQTRNVAERHMEREAIIRQRQAGGYIERIDDGTMLVLATEYDPTHSIKVVKCYSESCSMFRNLVKSHR
jgi:hypothetical protein